MAILDLNGTDVTLPDDGFFGGQSYLNGSDDVTNSGNSSATLTEGGGSGPPTALNTYSGLISDGATHKTAITHTSGFVDITGTNTYSGGTNLQGGTIEVDNSSFLDFKPAWWLEQIGYEGCKQVDDRKHRIG
jgi:fibronectin-binding autotransporter adhesin